MATISSLRTDDNDNTYPIEFLKFQDGIQPVLLGMTKDLNSRTSSARIRQSVGKTFRESCKKLLWIIFQISDLNYTTNALD